MTCVSQCIRYDICFSTNQLTTACSKLREDRMTMAERLLRYTREGPSGPGHHLHEKAVRHSRLHERLLRGKSRQPQVDIGLHLFISAGALMIMGAMTQTLNVQSTTESELIVINC